MTTPRRVNRILYVDDEPDFAELAATYLEREDDVTDVETATSAAQGLEHLEQGDIDCIVSDFDMPGTNGLEFLERVRATDDDLPFILFTGKGSEEVASDAIAAGATDYLQKGGDSGQWDLLANRIRNAIEGYRSEQQLQEYRTLVETVADPMYILDDEGVVTLANDAMEEMVGMDSEDIVGMHVSKFLEGAYDWSEGLFDELHEERDWTTFEVDVSGSDRTVPAEIDVAPIDDTAGGHRSTVGVIRDITDRKTQEATIEASFGGILVLNDDGEIITWNERLADMWDLPVQILEEGDAAAVFDRMNERVEQPEALRSEFERLHDRPPIEDSGRTRLADGRIFDRYTAPVPGGNGGAAGRIWFFRDITNIIERKDQLERYETILKVLGDPVYAVDEEGSYAFVNDAYANQSERSREEIIGTPVKELRSVSEVERVQRLIEDLVGSDTRNEGIVEMVRETPAGKRQVENHIALLPLGEDGAYRGSAGILRDITERVERERTLEQYRSLVNAMTDPACIYDEEGRFVLANDILAEWYDVDREALIGQKSEMLEEIRQSADGDPIEELLAGEREEFRGEYETVDPDGNEGVIEYVITPLMIDGDSEGVVTVSRVITERKERERELEETQTVLRTVVENLPAGVIVEDSDRSVILVNGGIGDLLEGISAHALIEEDGQTLAEEVKDLFADPDAFVERSDRRIQQRNPVRHEELEMVDGRTLERDYIPYTLLDSPANLWLYRDITTRKERERELERQNHRLEQFTSIVSHDLRNPLNVAQGRLDLALDDVDSDHLEFVSEAQDRIQTLIDDLLVMARDGEADRMEESVDLAEIVEACWRNVATGDAENIVRTDRSIRADHARLRQLLENLIRNAIEHGAASTVTVGDLSGGFYVEDDGQGIPASKRTEVFEPGYSTAPDGTGLGLSIVEKVANEHDWTVSVTDGADGGARFEMRVSESN